MKKLAIILILGFVTTGFAARQEPVFARQRIGSIPAAAITKIDRIADKVVYTATFESKTRGQVTKGSISCWKEKSGRIGCTESGTIFTGRSANPYERPIADDNFYKLEKLYQKHEEK